MLAGSFVQIVVVVAFLVLAVLVVKLVLAPDGKRAAADQPLSAEARFQMLADRRLRPLMAAVVLQAAEHGRRAVYDRQLRGGEETWRLEVEQPDLPRDQPRPYIAISRGPGHAVTVVWGGTLPKPAADDDPYAEVSQRNVDWREMDRVLLRFAERTFRPQAANAPRPASRPE